MSSPQVISALIVLAAGVLGLLLRYYKGSIGERTAATDKLTEGQLNIAQGTVKFVKDTTEEFRRLGNEMADQRRELEALGETCSTLRSEANDLRFRVNDLQHRLEAVTRERDDALEANRALSERVDAQDEEIRNLRQRVEDLQRRRGPAGPRGEEGPTGPAGTS